MALVSCYEHSEKFRDIYESTTPEARNAVIKNFIQDSLLEKLNTCPDFDEGLPWMNSQPLSIFSDLKGKVVLLDFFTYCCINCQHILPILKSIEREFKIEDGFVVIGVHYGKFTNEKDTEKVQNCVHRLGITHPVVNDVEGKLWNSFEVMCWPTLLLIGPRGEPLLVFQGEVDALTLRNIVSGAIELCDQMNMLSRDSLPQIKVSDFFSHSRKILRYPAKIASVLKNDGSRIIAISNAGNNRIIIADTDGIVLNEIGNGVEGFKDGPFEEASFNSPQGVAFRDESHLYVADTENHAIRLVDLVEKKVKTLVGNGKQGSDRVGGKLGYEQELSSPWDVVYCQKKKVLIIAMAGIHQIWGLFEGDDDVQIGKSRYKRCCSAIAGNGREENRNNCYPKSAGFAQPSGIAYCEEKDMIFLADSESSSVRRMDLNSGSVSGIVGGSNDPKNLFAFGDVDGYGTDVKLQHPLGITWHGKGGKLYISDTYNHKIKFVEFPDQEWSSSQRNKCSTLPDDWEMNEPDGLCVIEDKLFIVDTNNHRILSCDLTSYEASEFVIRKIRKQKPILNVEDAEKSDVIIHQSGGAITVQITLKPANSFKFSKADQAAKILIAGEKLTVDKNEARVEEDTAEYTVVVLAASDISGNSNTITIECSHYICGHGLCLPKSVIFHLRVSSSANAASNILVPLIKEFEY